MDTWTLEDATHELPEVVRRALDHQPQVVVRGGDGEDAVVVVARSEYERLRGPAQASPESHPGASGRELLAFLQNSPLAEAIRDGLLTPEDLYAERSTQTRPDIDWSE